jgi:Domain of unknown function (DUF4865)
MILAHYAHRLPADYDIDAIRERAKTRGPLWDDVPELYFKGFLLREAGRSGAIANNYSSLYLWQTDAAFRDFLTSGRYRTATDLFGRASIQTRVTLDARRGRASHARFVYEEELSIPVDADLTAVFENEIDRNRRISAVPQTVAAVIAVETQRWRITRIVLSEAGPGECDLGTPYEVLHLARPLLDTLPSSDAR